MPNQKHREGLFLLLCLAAAGICAGLAFRFAVPLQAQTPQTLPDTKALAEYTQVELNTADADALCTLPGVGPRNAQAILDYRAQYGSVSLRFFRISYFSSLIGSSSGTMAVPIPLWVKISSSIL